MSGDAQVDPRPAGSPADAPARAPQPAGEVPGPASGPAEPQGGGFRLLVEMGPLIAFFTANWKWDLFVATGIFMVATVAAVVASRVRERRWPAMPLVTAVFVLVFGGLTLYLQDETFIKIKPTIVNLLFSSILFVGLARGRSYIKLVLETALQLDERGWRILTFRWAWFFIFLAGVNELVWRSFDTDFWVGFKTWGIFPMTLVFTFLQIPLVQRHDLSGAAPTPEGEGG